MFAHLRCYEEVENGKCSRRSSCLYHHNEPMEPISSNYSELHENTSISVSKVYDPAIVEPVEQYDPYFPAGRATTYLPYSHIAPIPKTTTYIKELPQEVTYAVPNDRKKKLDGPPHSSQRPALVRPRITPVRPRKPIRTEFGAQKPKKTIEKPVAKEQPKKEQKKEDLLDIIPKAEMPIIPYDAGAPLSIKQRRPKLEHALRLYIQHLGPNETYHDAIPKAVTFEKEIMLQCRSFMGYRGLFAQKYVELRDTLSGTSGNEEKPNK